MDNEKLAILENMSEAIALARHHRKSMYIFNLDGFWGFSGKLPPEAKDFYIAYKDGNMDQSQEAPYITADEWTTYWLGYVPKFSLPQALGPQKKEESWIMTHAKKIFSGYCAFSPFIALALLVFVSHFTKINDFWAFACIVCMTTIPLSLIFVIMGLIKTKSEKVAIMATTLATDGHLLLYGSLWALKNDWYSGDLMFCSMMAGLIMAGSALLLFWDNELAD